MHHNRRTWAAADFNKMCKNVFPPQVTLVVNFIYMIWIKFVKQKAHFQTCEDFIIIIIIST